LDIEKGWGKNLSSVGSSPTGSVSGKFEEMRAQEERQKAIELQAEILLQQSNNNVNDKNVL